MRRLLLALLLLCAAPAVAETDAAGHRLAQLYGGRAGAPDCSVGYHWCVGKQDDGIVVTHGPARAMLPLFANSESEGHAPWWLIVLLKGETRAFVGVIDTYRTMYSGGGASASTLTLYDVGAGETPTALFSVPFGAYVMIRACFGEDDMRAPRDACHDEYRYTSSLHLDVANTGALPVFIYKSLAETYPGARQRDADSTQEPPLRRGDLVWAKDQVCSATRFLRADADGVYHWSAPLPECADYTIP